MNDFSLKISAYIDGELTDAEAQDVEALLASDPSAQAELDALMDAQALAADQFEKQLQDPVPFELAQLIKNTPLEEVAKPHQWPAWTRIAASLVILTIGGVGGYVLKDQTSPVIVAGGWLDDIADYHAVYASQGRHLVEVAASEADHIETWLGNTVGAQFTIPDLSQFDLTFEGGRLLVANGKPVAQLMYRQPDGTVVALCLQSSVGGATQPPATFNPRTINGFDFVSWKANGAAYVVIGPNGQSNLPDIAAHAAVNV